MLIEVRQRSKSTTDCDMFIASLDSSPLNTHEEVAKSWCTIQGAFRVLVLMELCAQLNRVRSASFS